MTRTEFIEDNLPLYHITPTRNIEGILANGLQTRNGVGICVIRNMNSIVIQYITEIMLINEGDHDFSIIEILPREHAILPEEIIDDQVVEITNPIHNYIKRSHIQIQRRNIIQQYQHPEHGIMDIGPLIAQITTEIFLEHLEP